MKLEKIKKHNSLAVLILAAGSSSRLGEPKQLLLHNEHTLLHIACTKALEISDDVNVVLGSNYEVFKNKIKDLHVKSIYNKEYEYGLSTSIKIGIQKLQDFERVLIMLCDQPFIPLEHLQKLVEKSSQTEDIVCSFYKDEPAVPAIFPKKTFLKLLRLRGDRGAKKIILKNPHHKLVLEDIYAQDIDTQEDKKYLK